MVKTSIVVPVFNRGEYLRYSLQSILNQKEQDIEIILVDDFSTDNSFSIMQEYANSDERIKIIKNKMKGAGAARNEGLKHTCGETVMFLDSDDMFHPDMVKTAYETYKKENADIVCFDLHVAEVQDCTNINVVETLEEADLKRLKMLTPPPQLTDLNKDTFFLYFKPFCWNKLYKTSFILDNKLYFMNTEVSNDLYFVFLALANSKKIVWLQKTFVVWCRHNGTITRNRSAGSFNDLEIYNQIEIELKKKKLNRFLRPLRCVEIRSCLDALGLVRDKNDFIKILKIIRRKLKIPFFEFIFNLPKVDYLGTNYRRTVFILKYAPIKVLIDFLKLKNFLKCNF